jgi:hypothetical protein
VPGAALRTGSKSRRGSNAAAARTGASAGGAAPSGSVARAAAADDSSNSPGLLGLSDPAVALGYLVLLLGVALTALSVRRARSRAVLRRSPPERAP